MRLFIIGIIGVVILMMTQSCDKVENPFPPALNVELDSTLYPGIWSDYVANEWPDLTTMVNDDPSRNALIEDYTGHNCTGCPAAATVAHNIHDGNPSRIFVAGIHSSNIGMSSFQTLNVSSGYTVDFTNQNGLDLGYFFGSTLSNSGFFGNPAGTVNRTIEGSEYFYASGLWSSKANAVLASTLQVALKGGVNFYASTKGMFLHTEIEVLDDNLSADNLGIVTYLIEDSLVAPQLNAGTYEANYIHRDILRGTLSGSEWGRDVVDGLEMDGKFYLDYSFVVPNQLAPEGDMATFNQENMHLLIYVYDKISFEIYQVIKKKLE